MAVSRTVVLGTRGFVARGVIEVLAAAGDPYRAIGSSQVDLTAADAVPKLKALLEPGDAVVVCSALTPEHGRDRATFLKNVQMIDHLAGVLEEAPCAHVVYLSSDSITCPAGDFYALAHLVREHIMQTVCVAAAIPLTILRPGAVFGPGDTHNAYGPSRFVRTARVQRKISLFGEGEEQRDHIYIRDLARIVQLTIRQGVTGVFSAVTGEPVTFREIAEAISRVLGGGIAIESMPRAVPVVHRHADPAPLLAALRDFEPTSLDNALIETIASNPVQ